MNDPFSMRILVTAGNTRERIDQVRDWGNIFTGETGFQIAQAAARLGPVDLVTSNPEHRRQAAESGLPIMPIGFTDHADLRRTLSSLMNERRYACVFMTAAVSDYTPSGVYEIAECRREVGPDGREREVWVVRDVQAGKVKSSFERIAVAGRRTEKLVDLFRGEWGYGGILVKFKLEVGLAPDHLIAVGQESRAASGADYLVANTLDMVRGDKPGAWLLSDLGAQWVERQKLPERMAELAAAAFAGDRTGRP